MFSRLEDMEHVFPNDLRLMNAFAVGVPLALLVLVSGALFATSSRHAKKRRRHMSVTVKWGKERMHIPLAHNTTTAPLSVLREKLADHTGLPADSFKLIHAGAVMKDDNATLSAYGIRPGSTIALIGGGAPIPEPAISKSKPSQPSTEISTIAAVHSELSRVNSSIAPSLNAFLSFLSSPSSDPEYKPQQNLSLEQEHTRIGEMLLQSLLRLDVLNMDGAWTDARKERKNAVKQVQAMLDKLDLGWTERDTTITIARKQDAQL